MSDETWRARRASFLALLFPAACAGGLAFVLIAACGGLSVQVIAVVASVGMLGYLHYVWWGQALDAEVAGEREQQQVQDRRELERRPDTGFEGDR